MNFNDKISLLLHAEHDQKTHGRKKALTIKEFNTEVRRQRQAKEKELGRELTRAEQQKIALTIQREDIANMKEESAPKPKKKKKKDPHADWKPQSDDDHVWEGDGFGGIDNAGGLYYGNFKTKGGAEFSVEGQEGALGGSPEWKDNIMDMVGYDVSDDPEEFIEYTFSGNHGYEITGKGEAFEVFRTASKNLMALAKEVEPAVLSFSASNKEPSRVSLYNFFTKKVAKLMPEYEAVKSYKGLNSTEFALIRKDARVDYNE